MVEIVQQMKKANATNNSQTETCDLNLQVFLNVCLETDIVRYKILSSEKRCVQSQGRRVKLSVIHKG